MGIYGGVGDWPAKGSVVNENPSGLRSCEYYLQNVTSVFVGGSGASRAFQERVHNKKGALNTVDGTFWSRQDCSIPAGAHCPNFFSLRFEPGSDIEVASKPALVYKLGSMVLDMGEGSLTVAVSG